MKNDGLPAPVLSAGDGAGAVLAYGTGLADTVLLAGVAAADVDLADILVQG